MCCSETGQSDLSPRLPIHSVGSRCPPETWGRWSMAIGEPEERSITPARVAGFVVGTLVILGITAFFLVSSGPPQLAADDDVFNGVDALFTAVTARDEKLLDQCEKNLSSLRDAGKLAREPAAYLDRIVRKARG